METPALGVGDIRELSNPTNRLGRPDGRAFILQSMVGSVSVRSLHVTLGNAIARHVRLLRSVEELR